MAISCIGKRTYSIVRISDDVYLTLVVGENTMETRELNVAETLDTVKKFYEVPSITEEMEMSFTRESFEEFCADKTCFGCTNCSCR
jgi:hypothetical protein